MEIFTELGTLFIVIIVILALFDSVMKLIALWHSAGRKQLAWFICIAIFNTAGILPIIYLLTNKNKKVVAT